MPIPKNPAVVDAAGTRATRSPAVVSDLRKTTPPGAPQPVPSPSEAAPTPVEVPHA